MENTIKNIHDLTSFHCLSENNEVFISVDMGSISENLFLEGMRMGTK